MFRDEQERQRAREAAVNVMGPHAYVSDEYLGLEFDRLYPPVVDAPKNLADVVERAKWGSAPSPAFAAAVDAYSRSIHALYGEVRASEIMAVHAACDAARAALVRCHLEEVERASNR